jgi:hypothetical protein
MLLFCVQWSDTSHHPMLRKWSTLAALFTAQFCIAQGHTQRRVRVMVRPCLVSRMHSEQSSLRRPHVCGTCGHAPSISFADGGKAVYYSVWIP